MSRFTINLDTPAELCKSCGSLSVLPQADGTFACESCGLFAGVAMVDTFVQFSGIKASKARYSMDEYRNNLYSMLRECCMDVIPDEVVTKLDEVKSKGDGLTWIDLKKALPKKYGLKNRCICALPAYLGFEYSIHDSWLKCVELAITTDKNISTQNNKKKSKLNNWYVLKQVVRMSGYYTNWIPCNLTVATIRRLNKRWRLICNKLRWDYVPLEAKSFIDLSVLKPPKDVSQCVLMTNGVVTTEAPSLEEDYGEVREVDESEYDEFMLARVTSARNNRCMVRGLGSTLTDDIEGEVSDCSVDPLASSSEDEYDIPQEPDPHNVYDYDYDSLPEPDYGDDYY